MHLIKLKVRDPMVLRLIWKYLRSPMQVDGKLQKRRKGVPQGGPLSPLLSNIVLNELDMELKQRELRFVRYADDFSIFLKTTRSAHRVKRRITRKTIPASFDERIERLNLLTRGWLNYFKPASIQGKLETMDGWVRNRLRYCIWHHWKRPRRRAINLARLGVPYDMAWQWGHSRMGGWAVSCSPILRTTITLDRLNHRGYVSFLEYYLALC